MKISHLLGTACVAVTLAITQFAANAQGPGRGKGMPAEARETIHQLFDSHDKFHREVKITDEGYVSKTTSNDPAAVDLLQAHLKQMEERLEQGRMVRRWDPAFEELVEHYDDIELKVAKIEDGISVTAVGRTDSAKKVARNHGEIISQFIKNGWSEHDKSHPKVAGESSGPAREGRGKPCKKCAGASENGNSCEKCAGATEERKDAPCKNAAKQTAKERVSVPIEESVAETKSIGIEKAE